MWNNSRNIQDPCERNTRSETETEKCIEANNGIRIKQRKKWSWLKQQATEWNSHSTKKTDLQPRWQTKLKRNWDCEAVKWGQRLQIANKTKGSNYSIVTKKFAWVQIWIAAKIELTRSIHFWREEWWLSVDFIGELDFDQKNPKFGKKVKVYWN